MTPKEFTDKMQKISDKDGDDCEVAHGDMDDLMGEALTELGFGDGVEIFNNQGKWYA